MSDVMSDVSKKLPNLSLEYMKNMNTCSKQNKSFLPISTTDSGKVYSPARQSGSYVFKVPVLVATTTRSSELLSSSRYRGNVLEIRYIYCSIIIVARCLISNIFK